MNVGTWALQTSTLDVLMLLLKRNIALRILQLAHNLDCHSFALTNVEAKSVGC